MHVVSLQEVRLAVLEALGRHLHLVGVDTDAVDGTFDLIGSGVLDSVSFVELLMQVEEALGQPIDLAELDFSHLATLDGLVGQLYGQQALGNNAE